MSADAVGKNCGVAGVRRITRFEGLVIAAALSHAVALDTDIQFSVTATVEVRCGVTS